MDEIIIGGYALSEAGHDSGKLYVIIDKDNEYVYLVDGKIRTIAYPKRKNIKHISVFHPFDDLLIDKINNQTIRNEEIKKSLKLLQKGNSSKEDK